VIDNDANAAALGAYFLDAGQKAKNLICVTLGTGVGGGIILDGKIYRGATGTAGEIGHIHYDANGPLCKCGSHGCIEVYAGAPRMIEQGKKIKSKILNKLTGGNMKNLTPKILQEAALLGDKAAQDLWKETGTKLGVIFADLINILNPEMIIISGGISKANRLLTDPIKRTVMERAFKTPARACEIVVSKFTSRLGVVGAALLAE
jgi:glucokinase